MGFYGKPSGGCDECRARKIKCDQTKPTCRQCAQLRLKCPGYRDLLSVVFRDQSNDVIEKATRAARFPKKKGKSRSTAAIPTPSIISTASNSGTPTPETPANEDGHSSRSIEQLRRIPIMFNPSGDHGQDEAICYFLNSFCWQSCCINFEDWQRDPSIASKALVAASSAVGFGNLSAVRESPAMRQRARDSYATALRYVNQSLSNSSMAVSDVTFAAIILLSLFETITYKDLMSKNRWITHVDGCTSLAAIRGVDRLLTPAGIKMFLEWRGQLIVGALQRGTPVPPILMEFAKLVDPVLLTEHQYESRAAALAIEVANFRASILSQELTDSGEILAAAYSLDAKLETWAAMLHPKYNYQIVPLPADKAMVATVWGGISPYGGYYHKYDSELFLLNGWCNYRVSRILVCETILNCLRPKASEGRANPNFIARCQKIRDSMLQLAIDICASVPHAFGLLSDKYRSKDKDYGTLVGGYMLMLPLYTAGCVVNPDHPLRKFAIDCFQIIAHRMGIDHGLAHIEPLKEQEGTARWVDELEESQDVI